MVLAFLQPDTARNVLLTLLGVGYLGYHVLHWWRRRSKTAAKKNPGNDHGRKPVDTTVCRVRKGDADSGLTRRTPCRPPAARTTQSADILTADQMETGEALYTQARTLQHQEIPDFDLDGPYLELLGKSAAAGYAPALAKLGEYAMRRAAWVEAYYWMKLAQRNGLHGLSPTLREIRKNWSSGGFPDEAENVNALFTVEAGSLGRALLHIDSGHEAARAKEFLKENYPEFII